MEPKQPHHTKIFRPKDRRTSRQNSLKQVFNISKAASQNRAAKVSLAPVRGLRDEEDRT